MMEAGVSIVLCCHNSEKRLPKVLDCLKNQKGTEELNWEILLIDNASSDNTIRWVSEYSTKCKLPIRILMEPKVGLSFARMTGIEASKYDIICYVDDDNWLNENYIATAYKIMKEHDDIGICGGYGIAAFDKGPPKWFPFFQAAYAVGPQGKESGYLQGPSNLIYGAGLTLRKSAWHVLQRNGFSYMLTGRKGKSLSSGEDSELCLAIQLAGYKIWYEPSLVFEHYMPPVRLTYSYLKNLFRAFGKSDVILGLYFNQFNINSPIKKKVINNYYLCLLYHLYALKTPMLNYLFKSGNEVAKMWINLALIRNFAKIKEHLRWFRNYSSVAKSIAKIKSFNLN